MAVSTMLWRPDTCGCEIEETHDPSDPTYGVRFSRVLNKCPAHAGLADVDVPNVIFGYQGAPPGENRRKNEIHGFLLQGLNGNPISQLRATGRLDDSGQPEQIAEFQAGIDWSWSFEGQGPDRVLHVTVIGGGNKLTQAHRNQFAQFANGRFGNGKVILH